LSKRKETGRQTGIACTNGERRVQDGDVTGRVESLRVVAVSVAISKRVSESHAPQAYQPRARAHEERKGNEGVPAHTTFASAQRLEAAGITSSDAWDVLGEMTAAVTVSPRRKGMRRRDESISEVMVRSTQLKAS
jgi:hypothetical protein